MYVQWQCSDSFSPLPPLQPKLSRQVSATEGSEGEAGEGNHRSPEVPPAAQERGRVTPSGLPPAQDPGTSKSEVITSPVQGASKPLLEPPGGHAHTGLVQPVLEQQKSTTVGPGGVDDCTISPHPSTKGKPASEVVAVPGKESSKPLPAVADPSPQQGNESLSRTSSLSRSHSDDQQPAPTPQQQQPPTQSQETVPASTVITGTQTPPEKPLEAPQTQQQNPPAEGLLESQQLPTTTPTTTTTATTSSTFSTGSSSSLNGSKKKQSRVKKLRLNLVEVMEDGVAKCTLATVAGQVVKFQFSVEYDKPQEIFQKFVSAHTHTHTHTHTLSPSPPSTIYM